MCMRRATLSLTLSLSLPPPLPLSLTLSIYILQKDVYTFPSPFSLH